MGIQINGQTDTVTSTAAGGKVTVTPASFPSVDNLNATGIVTASSFRGALTGNVTGNVNATGVSTFSSVNVTGNVSIGGTLTYDDVTNVDSIGLVTARSGVRIDAGGLVVTAGVSTFTNGPILVGTATSTGTASQPLQVTGGAYVSGNLGVGATNPTEKLDVRGSISAAGRSLNVPHIMVKNSSGDITYFEYYFTMNKSTGSGTATTQNILSVANLSSFHQAAFTVEYGTRIQGVSDSTTAACLKQFGVNKFNSGSVAITDTNDIASDTNSNTHTNITCVTNGASGYIIRGEFSSTASGSSFISGVLRGWGVSDSFNASAGTVATLTFAYGPT